MCLRLAERDIDFENQIVENCGPGTRASNGSNEVEEDTKIRPGRLSRCPERQRSSKHRTVMEVLSRDAPGKQGCLQCWRQEEGQ